MSVDITAPPTRVKYKGCTPVRERPIMFGGAMVRAILAGAKTQTRRLVKMHADGTTYDRCRYGAPGERLWVREAWKASEYSCTSEHQDEDHVCSEHCRQAYVYYAATPREGLRPRPDGARITYLDASSPLTEWYQGGWKPSRHMPRWASRLTLEVTGVRVERLHEITNADAMAEGIPQTAGEAHMAGLFDMNREPGHEWDNRTSAENFARLWESINGKRAPWASNPFVWVIRFAVVKS